jgi:DMSO/TMAO reductase YedYZ heme-binding membrane subunit
MRATALKYLGVGLLAAALSAYFYARANTIPNSHHPILNSLNLGIAYASLALLGLALAIGPLSRLGARTFGRLVGLRREVGVVGGLLALAHVVLSVRIHVNWRWPLFFFNVNNDRIVEVNYRVDGIGNWLGLAAVLLLLPILLSSNDLAERYLGAPGWKWLQGHTYTLFALAAFHTSIFLQAAAKGKTRPADFWPIFWLTVGGTLLLQSLAFAVTIARRRARIRRSIADRSRDAPKRPVAPSILESDD